ncbi:unnamed protein product, partial [Tetraodon nigroviridis]
MVSAQTGDVAPFSTELALLLSLVALSHTAPKATRYSLDFHRRTMCSSVMPMTNNAGGMCCEEIEEFVVGRGTLDCRRERLFNTPVCRH